MQDAIRVLAGDCTVTYFDGEERVRRGSVVTLVKPDNTVLVHDASGYQPAAWLTRANAVQFAREDGEFVLAATDADERLRVESHESFGTAHYPVTPAGPPVGTCPDCAGRLVRDRGRVVCTGCGDGYVIPRDATVLDATCDACGLPTMRVERGAAVEVCVDRDCEAIEDVVAERFDGEWDCPECDGDLAIQRHRGLRAVCGDCGSGFQVPSGTLAGTCDCGLPRFDMRSGERCLDSTCD